MGLTGEQKIRRAQFAALSDLVRSSFLPLHYFTRAIAPDSVRDPQTGEERWPIPRREEPNARLRRGAVLAAALRIINECLDDVAEASLGLTAEGWADTFVYRWFPKRFRSAYDEAFLRNVAVTAVKVAGDLAHPRADHPACPAEEMVLNAVIGYAGELMGEAGLGEPWVDLHEVLLEDMDFEMLYMAQFDGLEDDTALKASLGLMVPGVADWFTAFNADRYPHPYTETEPAAPPPHAVPAQELPPEVADSPAPLTGLAAVSDLVAQGRAAARGQAAAGTWVPDETDAEASFAQLDALLRHGGSGWLVWEPAPGADLLSEDGTILAHAHRHSAEPDRPWLETSFGAIVLRIPLTVVVSWRPDPQVLADWKRPSSAPLGEPPG